ncbi:RNase adapter RapZ [Gleimia sp. 6138-11-ORH1]|uniref:RNase adapter RapZ n=1 Tax=Gleimia sp. 6138-11-ORH1 TaxID=2973937 RepID=UPI002169C839|nr:RNase adapter RapZ [Gleimia sp. 6138-11-ORH1]MCS4484320.1 RNase adapter RapZ [Gleimia sp. 6138-11-ORH1]
MNNLEASDSTHPHAVPTDISVLDEATSLPQNLGTEMLIITGMSGAGRTRASMALEDLDWYVVDNLPPVLLPVLAGMMTPDGGGVHRLAAVVDVRSGGFFRDFESILAKLAAENISHRLIFLEADEAELVKRYESNRRPHPLQEDGRILDGIAKEKELLAPLRALADEIVDTTKMSVHDLTRHMRDVVAGDSHQTLNLTVMSFGFKYGLPLDADHVLDVRFLKNPYWVSELRHLTGRDEPVAKYVLEQPGAREFAENYADLLAPMLAGYLSELKPFVTIAVGCTGGKHRSVANAELIAAKLREKGFPVRVIHRDLGRE